MQYVRDVNLQLATTTTVDYNRARIEVWTTLQLLRTTVEEYGIFRVHKEQGQGNDGTSAVDRDPPACNQGKV